MDNEKEFKVITGKKIVPSTSFGGVTDGLIVSLSTYGLTAVAIGTHDGVATYVVTGERIHECARVLDDCSAVMYSKLERNGAEHWWTLGVDAARINDVVDHLTEGDDYESAPHSFASAERDVVRELIPLVIKDGRQDGAINSDGDYDEWYETVIFDEDDHFVSAADIPSFVLVKRAQHYAEMLDFWNNKETGSGLIEKLIEEGMDDEQAQVILEAYEDAYAVGLTRRLQSALDDFKNGY